ncbi:hypothetical protein B484DRAFT_447682 [Ochromonadaceae sp. CCMP2298]|nr:hypothetical protein B484DRAFT_447682 [Ochromonadaceae sp. CCMP2298]|mmetsp:Transcript_16942/g.37671  ORF Transcript_16942/g.37671 Transcript_16942/m.37671 type:complete len:128 (+) Transcript_16942:81-464(+)
MAAFEATFPLQEHQSILVNGVPTDLVITGYYDRVFVIISQLDSVGTILKADAEKKSDGGFIFEVDTVLGKRDDPLLTIYARQIVERLSKTSTKPLLLSISLRDNCRSTECFATILNALYEFEAWALL